MDNIQTNNNYFQGKHTANFSSVLRKLTTPRKAIAIDLGVSYSTYDNWYQGIYAFPPDLIPALCLAVNKKDRDRVLAFLLRPLKRVACTFPAARRLNRRSILKGLVRIGSSAGQILSDTEIAYADGIIERSEYEAIHSDIYEAIKAELSLDHNLQRLVREQTK